MTFLEHLNFHPNETFLTIHAFSPPSEEVHVPGGGGGGGGDLDLVEKLPIHC